LTIGEETRSEMERLIVEFAFRAALIVAAAAVTLRVLRIRTAAAEHAIWTGVLVVMLALPVWISWGPKAALPVLPARGGAAAFMTAAALVTADPASEVPVRPQSYEPASSSVWNRSGNAVLMGVYFIGVSLLLLRLAIGTIRANRLTSALCVVPVTVGFFRPRVILPEYWRGWPDAQLDAVLTHERAHARRRDPLVQWLALLNRAVFWFHPLAWWLERRLCALAEEACDLAVIEQGHDPRDYSRYLLDLARVVRRAGMRVNVTGMAMPGSYLPQRVRKIVAGVGAPRISHTRMAGAAVACTICSVMFAAGTLARVANVPVSSAPPVEIHVPAAELIPAPAEPVRKLAQMLLAQANPAALAQSAQTRGPAEQFEVASVKPSAPVPPSGGVYFGPPRGGPGTPDPGLITWTYARLIDLLMTAYDMKNYQINGPAWLYTERYDIVARVPAGATKEQVMVMWQKLLAERFGVVLHHEPKEFQVEDLVIDKGGSKLKETTWDPASPLPPGPPQQDRNGGLASPGQVARIVPHENGANVHTIGRAQPMSQLTNTIGNMLGQPVLDKTGLAGKYDYTIDFAVVTGVAYRPPPLGVGPGPGAAPGDASEPLPDIAAAIRQQLGLRLVPSKARIDVVVIDEAEKVPTAN
jgi:uncharacterized protein (TIGR03435 family)